MQPHSPYVLGREASWDESSMQTAITGYSLNGSPVVPSSRMLRAAEKVLLVNKSHTSFKDAQKGCRDILKRFITMEKVFKVYSQTAEEISVMHGHKGQLSHNFLRNSSLCLHEVAKKANMESQKTYEELEDVCKAVKSAERAYRKSSAANARAYKTLSSTTATIRHTPEHMPETKLEREIGLQQVQYDFVKANYEIEMVRVSIQLLGGLADQCRAMATAFTEQTTEIVRSSPSPAELGSSYPAFTSPYPAPFQSEEDVFGPTLYATPEEVATQEQTLANSSTVNSSGEDMIRVQPLRISRQLDETEAQNLWQQHNSRSEGNCSSGESDDGECTSDY